MDHPHLRLQLFALQLASGYFRERGTVSLEIVDSVLNLGLVFWPELFVGKKTESMDISYC